MSQEFSNLLLFVCCSRKGANAVGVRAELLIDDVPAEIRNLMTIKKTRNSK